MKKKFHGNSRPLEVDSINGEYYLTIPEEIINELSWYEDTMIQINLEGNELVLSEYKED
jgi:hypothetical protein